MSFENFATVRTFVNGFDAEIARSALEAAGIHAFVRRDDCGGVRPSLWMTGIALIVRAYDLPAASVVLSTPALYDAGVAPPATPDTPPSAYDFNAAAIGGGRISFDVFRGRVLLIVNVASYCGYTSQYSDLERLYRKYDAQGFTVLAFPCDQFGRQEPGTDAEIRAFCSLNYDTTFPLFAKINVNGAHAHPLYRFLKTQKKSWLGSSVKWNFTKFLTDRQGHVIKRYGPTDLPSTIEPDIVTALADGGWGQVHAGRR